MSEGAKSILSIAVCWHSPYCAILPAILPDKQSRLSRGAIDGGGEAGGWRQRAQEEKHIYMSGERIFPAPLSRHLHRAGRSAEPRAVGLSLSLFTLQSRFYSGSTTTLFDNCHRDESIWTLCRHPPCAALEFFKQ